jgi:hypothetical protein
MRFIGKAPVSVIRSDPATRAAWTALPLPLRECGEIAGLRLSGVLSDALRQAEEQLFSASAQALTRVEREGFLDAAEFARARRECLVADFLRHFETRYVRACRYQPTVLSGYLIDFDPSQLKIVEHDFLDDSLHPGRIAEAIQNASWHTLQDLTECFGKLLGAATLKSNDMPLSPKLIEAAVSDAARDQPWRHGAKHRLIGSLRSVLPERVGRLYRDLAEHMQSMAGLADAGEAAVSTASYGRTGDWPVELLPTLEAETNDDAVDAAAGNEVVEFAMAVARDEVARRQVETPSPVDPGAAVCLAAVLPTLPGPVAPAAPLEEIRPIAQVRSQTAVEQTGRVRAGVMPAELERGAWLEFRAADGSFRELKLAWISPRKNLYLLTNREGERGGGVAGGSRTHRLSS